MADSSLLIGDIGGTNARFALADRNSPGFSDAMTLQCADYATADAAIKDYLQSLRRHPMSFVLRQLVLS